MSDRRPRLFVTPALARGAEIACETQQANYLINVLRGKIGDAVLLFNGRDGEWRAEIAAVGRNRCTLKAVEQTRPQSAAQDIALLFAPLKHARLDYMVQKATEMGVSSLRPVMTDHTIAGRVNLDRMRANVIEAAEQCGILSLPGVLPPEKLETLVGNWPRERALIYADEDAPLSAPVAALGSVREGPLAVLIGPEGGFSQAERRLLRSRSFVYPLSLGPRIMRADTAAVAALALVNAVLGDWR